MYADRRYRMMTLLFRLKPFQEDNSEKPAQNNDLTGQKLVEAIFVYVEPRGLNRDIRPLRYMIG